MTASRETAVRSTFNAKQAAADFELQDPPAGFIENPYRWYQALRELNPVKRLRDGSVLLTRHADLEYVYRNPAIFSSDKREEFLPKFGQSLLYEHHTTSLVFNDPPLQTRVRKLLQGALSTKAVAYMEKGIIALVDGLLTKAAARQSIDLIADFATEIPVEVIGNLLGVPHADRGPLRGWSLSILGALEPVISARQKCDAEQSVAEFLDYLKILVAERRANPGDPEIDILTRLIIGEAGGERLSEKDLLQNCIFILNAGHETTTNLIGNAIVTLVDWPDQRARLIADPKLITSAVEEFLRFESSNQLGNRRMLSDAEVGGVMLPVGTLITLCIGAANRDPAQFKDPDRLDLARSPNRHLAFASGTHLCLGMNLARLEGRIAISHFLAKFPDYKISGEPRRNDRLRFRGFAEVPLSLD